MKTNRTNSKTAGAAQTAADQIRPEQTETQQNPTETGTDTDNGAETAGNAVSRAAGRDEAPTPDNETGTAEPAPQARKTLANVPESPVTARQAESQVNDRPEVKAPSEAPFRTITAEQAKSLYHAVLASYITETRANLKTADEDHNPKTAKQVYEMEFNIGCLLRSHFELTPAEMVDLLPSNTNDPMDERIPEINATRTLFFMDHLHRILFRPGEQHRDERILQG